MRSYQVPWRLIFALGVGGGLYLSLRDPTGQAAWFAQADKLQHALGFLVLWFVGIRAWPRHTFTLIVGLLVLGVGIEVAQSFTPLRLASPADVLADAFGIGLGALWTWQGRRSAKGLVSPADS